jgi:hypothetical protein
MGQATAAEKVDLQLILAADVSRSVDPIEDWYAGFQCK